MEEIDLMKKLFRYLNPIDHLGEGKYSIIFPLLVNLLLCTFSELYVYEIAKNPMIVGMYIIFLNGAFIIYFSFREGLRGGFITVCISIFYYLYIIYTRHYKGDLLSTGIETTITLAVIYSILAWIIGWLKQRIDKLIESEANEKKRLQAIIQQLPVGVIITDGNGTLTETNKQVDKMLGMKMPIGFTLGRDTIDPAQAPIIEALTTGKPIIGRDLFFERNDGKKLYLQVSSAPIHNKKKRIIAAASIISDITAQKELERQKDDFLSMASHELKTPITSMKMFIDLQSLQLKKLKADRAIYLNTRILDQVNRLKELTNDLLDVSRIQTGKLRFNLEAFDLTQVVTDTIEGLQQTTKKHELILKDGYKELIKGDRYRIYQVLVNLIANAIKYSPNGKKIIVQIKKVKKTVVVSVQDFGIGIDTEQQNKIFDKLYQVTDPEEKTFPGLGLGLYISKEIVDRHNGKMWVESTKGEGSIFYFSLPLYVKKRNI